VFRRAAALYDHQKEAFCGDEEEVVVAPTLLTSERRSKEEVSKCMYVGAEGQCLMNSTSTKAFS